MRLGAPFAQDDSHFYGTLACPGLAAIGCQIDDGAAEKDRDGEEWKQNRERP
jgi:hypothetical protein